MKKGRILALGLVTALTVSAILAGTYAWQSVNQKQRNQYRGTASAGGRLHDDFSGINPYISARDTGNSTKVKKVYVENFTDADHGGLPVYARIRLSEYLEMGAGAGNSSAVNRVDANMKIVGKSGTYDPKLDQKNTWITYLWGQDDLDGSENSEAFRDYVTITKGTGTVYLPTYNMDKDSKAADVNGTLAEKYEDYKLYINQQTEWGVEVTALNTKGEDEMPAGVTVKQIRDAVMDVTTTPGSMTLKLAHDAGTINLNGQDYTIRVLEANSGYAEKFDIDFNGDDIWDVEVTVPEEPHKAKATQTTAEIISMAEWKAKQENKKIGNYWVYDTDGWVYWASPIEPGTASGCLIDGITMASATEPTGEYYYALNVSAQFASAGDWGKNGSTTSESFKVGDITNDALYLLDTVSGTDVSNYQVTVTPSAPITNRLNPGESVSFQVTVTDPQGGEINADSSNLTWNYTRTNVAAADPITEDVAFTKEADGTWKMTIGATDAGGTLNVTASYTDPQKNRAATSTAIEVKVATALQAELAGINAGDTTTVTIDGIEFYVAYKDETTKHQALLWSKEMVELRPFDTEAPFWESSSLRTYLNATTSGGFLNTYSEIAAVAKETTIYTRSELSNTAQYTATVDKIFVLSEEDISGTANGTTVLGDPSQAYTAGQSLADTIEDQKEFDMNLTGNTIKYCWLRSLNSTTIRVAALFADKHVLSLNFTNEVGVRPAFWVDL